jgi:hypothetical protein
MTCRRSVGRHLAAVSDNSEKVELIINIKIYIIIYQSFIDLVFFYYRENFLNKLIP